MPRIQMTRTVKIALLLLRVYLIAMLVLIVAKFILSMGKMTPPAPKEPPRVTTPATGLS